MKLGKKIAVVVVVVLLGFASLGHVKYTSFAGPLPPPTSTTGKS